MTLLDSTDVVPMEALQKTLDNHGIEGTEGESALQTFAWVLGSEGFSHEEAISELIENVIELTKEKLDV